LTKSLNSRAVSPVIVGVLLIVIIVAGTLLGFIFLTGLSTGFRTTGNTGLSTTTTPHIYSTDARVDVLNNVANFSAVVSNTVSTPQVGEVDLTVGDHIVQTVPFALGNGETKTIQVTQALNQTGIWTFKVISNGIKVSDYSFTVMQTQDEADYTIGQWQSQNFYRNLLIVCYFLSIAAFAIAVASLARQPKAIRLE
jgi:hypothetical protein